ncbi:MAG: S-layer homology domain-containing protein [Clostridiales bacterium]|nr:MAG: S-layer homology domain-containing protein [Clostridiales bacterium]
MKKHIIFICTLITAVFICANACAMSEYDAMVQILEETGILMPADIAQSEEPITRAQFLKMASGLGVYPDGTVQVPDFDDVLPSHTAYAQIREARAKNIISGVGGNSFLPDEIITYEQASAMIINAMGLKRIRVKYRRLQCRLSENCTNARFK